MPPNGIRIFTNLTNGIGLLDDDPKHEALQRFANFIRIQSTTCEQNDWDRLIMDLDNNFLMFLALGYFCCVHDGSTHARHSRAMRQGLEFVKFMLNRYWFDRYYDAPDGQSTYFRTIRLSKKAQNKLKYYRRFLATDTLYLSALTVQTAHDGDYDWYVKKLHGMLPKEAPVEQVCS